MFSRKYINFCFDKIRVFAKQRQPGYYSERYRISRTSASNCRASSDKSTSSSRDLENQCWILKPSWHKAATYLVARCKHSSIKNNASFVPEMIWGVPMGPRHCDTHLHAQLSAHCVLAVMVVDVVWPLIVLWHHLLYSCPPQESWWCDAAIT